MATEYIPLTKDYNLKFSTTLNKRAVYFEIRTADRMRFVTIKIGDEIVVAGKKAIKGVSLLPNRYRKVIGGILYFGGADDGYPIPESCDNIATRLIYEAD